MVTHALDWLRKYGLHLTKGFLIVAVLLSMLFAAYWVKPQGEFIDKMLVWAFVVFVVGTAELFILFVVLSIWGTIDLPRAFLDKSEEPPASAGNTETKGTVSLSRLQAFLWTLILMIVYFHRVVADDANGLPTMPAELLMLMGMSSAVYLTSKEMDARRVRDKEASKAAAAGDAGGGAGGGGGPVKGGAA